MYSDEFPEVAEITRRYESQKKSHEDLLAKHMKSNTNIEELNGVID